MVGYDERQERQLSAFWIGTAGVLSGVFTRFLCQPLDVIKIRFQLQHEPIKPSATNYYWNLRQAFRRILKEEKYRALWKGHVPAQLLSGVYGLAQFSTYEYLTKLQRTLRRTKEEAPKTTADLNSEWVLNFLCGSLSGAAATVVSMPCDTLRTRLVGQGEPKIYKGVIHAVTTMIRKEGFLSLYKGLLPNLLQIMPHTGLQFGTFHVFSNAYWAITSQEPRSKLPVAGSFICGGAAGLTAKVVIYPLDLIKKRLQVQGFEEARRSFGKVEHYSGLIDCFKRTLLEEGPMALYKGLFPSAIKAVATTALTFTFYEEITHIFVVFGL